jgi:hypothetical protein
MLTRGRRPCTLTFVLAVCSFLFQNPKWSDPSGWAADATETCAADGGAVGGPPGQPRFSSERVGDTVEVEYDVEAVDGSADATAVGVTVDRPGAAQLPSLKIVAADDGRGTISVPVPPGSGDLTVRVSSYDESGQKSRAAVAPVGRTAG